MKTKETIERVIVPGASTYRPIDSIKMLRIYLREDMKRMGGGWLINPFRWLMGEDCSRMKLYIYVLRALEYVTNKYERGGVIRWLTMPMYLWLFFWHRRQSYKYGVHVAPNKCDYGLRIVHPGGILLNANHVGKYCTVTQGVVLGVKGYHINRPWVGDNVELTLGCKIIGKVIVGNNTVVCPNSVVIKNLPDNVIASGVPIRIIKERKVCNN